MAAELADVQPAADSLESSRWPPPVHVHSNFTPTPALDIPVSLPAQLSTSTYSLCKLCSSHDLQLHPLTTPQQLRALQTIKQRASLSKMITDAQLYSLAIFLGSAAMLLIVLYHFLEVNSEEHAELQKPKVAAKKIKA